MPYHRYQNFPYQLILLLVQSSHFVLLMVRLTFSECLEFPHQLVHLNNITTTKHGFSNSGPLKTKNFNTNKFTTITSY